MLLSYARALAVSALIFVFAWPAQASGTGTLPVAPDADTTLSEHAAAQADPSSRGFDARRWVDLQTASVDFRYRYIETSRDERTNNQLQHKQRLRVGLKLDPAGRYSVQTFSGTSNSFSSTWDNTGLGTGDASWPFAMRELYFAARPIDGIKGEVGGFKQLKGLATEITTFDNDNYLVGYRGTVARPAELYVDEISATAGFVGEFSDANVLHRLDGLGRHNYTQVLVRKRVSPMLALSADWESLDGISTLHQTVQLTLVEGPAIHGLRFEQYQRVEGNKGYGFAVAAERELTGTLTASGGYAQIDRDHRPVTGDRYGIGRRLFAEAEIELTPAVSVEIFYTHAVKNDVFLPNAQRFDVVATYDVLEVLRRAGVW